MWLSLRVWENDIKVTKGRITWIKRSLHHIEQEWICPLCYQKVGPRCCHCKQHHHTSVTSTWSHSCDLISHHPVYLLASNFTSARFCSSVRLYSKWIRNLICNEMTTVTSQIKITQQSANKKRYPFALTSSSVFNTGYPTWQATVCDCAEVHFTPSVCK